MVVSDGLDVARDPEDVRRVVGGRQGNDDGAVGRAVDVASQRGAGRLSRELWLGRSLGEWQNTLGKCRRHETTWKGRFSLHGDNDGWTVLFGDFNRLI